MTSAGHKNGHKVTNPLRLFEDGLNWIRVQDGNESVFKIFTRHYTFRHWRQRNGINGKRIAGPGESVVLISTDSRAIFIWRKEKFRRDNQKGIVCAVFRNEGSVLSSILIQQAEQIAQKKWPGERMYTYVNARKIKSENPGYCFICAGWRRCGISASKKLVILEKIPPT